jgi:hypothetical protein
MRRALVLALLIAAGSPVAASAAGAGEPKVGQYVDLAPVGLPIISDGRLRNYVFVNVRLQLRDGADPLKLREKEPYFRDALVRASHRRPFVVAGDWARIDEARLKSEMLGQAAAVAGPGVVTAVQLTSVTPQRRTGMAAPRP